MEIKNLSKKIGRYTAAAGAFLAVSHSAEAIRVLGSITGDDFLDNHGDMAYIDMNNDGNDDFMFYHAAYSYASYSYLYTFSYTILEGASGYIGLDNASWYWAKNYGIGELVGPLVRPEWLAVIQVNSFYSYFFNYAGSNSIYANPGLGCVGVSFMDGANTHYGYIQVMTDDVNNTVRVLNAYYETSPSTSITAFNASVPLLPIASGLGIGIIGLFAFLKRRKNQLSLQN